MAKSALSSAIEYQAKLLRWRVLDPAVTHILHRNAQDDDIFRVTIVKYDSHFSTGSDFIVARVARFPARLSDFRL